MYSRMKIVKQNHSLLHVYINLSLEQVWYGAAIYQQSGNCQGTSVQEQNTQICIARILLKTNYIRISHVYMY